MTPEQLRASILKAAFEGKLVEQNIYDESVANLLKRVEETQKKDIKEGKIKKNKKLGEIEDADIPFSLPSNWRYIKLGEIVQLVDGKKVKGSPYNYLEVKYLRGKIEPKTLTEGKYVTKGRMVILVDGENSGEVFELPEEGYLGSTFKIVYISPEIDKEFVLKFLELKRGELRGNKKGAAIPHLDKDLLFNYVIPIPPLEEQHRIVAKIEQILPYVDRYAASYEKLEQFNAKFPEEMKKSILQYAIQGKLVEQRPEEGTAEELYRQIQEEKQKLIKEGKIKKDKSLPEITNDEIPFDIPVSWKWVRLGKCGIFERGSGIKKDEVTPEGLPCVRYGQLYTTYKTRFAEAVSYVPQDIFDKCHKANQGDILMSLTGENEYDIALAVTYEGADEIAYGGDMTRFYRHCMNPLYLTYVLNSRYGILCKSKLASGNIIVHISNDKLATIPIPLPPLEEQHRIVSKIEELLPYCDKLENKK